VQITPVASGPAADDQQTDTVAGPQKAAPSAIRIPEPVTVVDGDNFFDFDVASYERKKTRRGFGPRAM